MDRYAMTKLRIPVSACPIYSCANPMLELTLTLAASAVRPDTPMVGPMV